MLKCFAAVLALLVGPTAHAALIATDNFTRDTSTGLDWLDVNLTAGLSFSDAASIYTGWRFASGDEIDALAQHYIGGSEETFSDAAFAPTLALISLLGITFDRPLAADNAATLATLGFYADGTAGRLGLAELVVNLWSPFPDVVAPFQGRWTTFDDFVPPDTVAPQIGSFLVRQSVPEPETWTLMLMALAGLAVTRRRRCRLAYSPVGPRRALRA